MAKQKEIKFQDRHGDLRGRQNGMEFWIRKGEPQTKSGEKRYFVAIYPVSNNPRQISTLSRQDFDLAGAKEFCKKIAAGEIKLEDLQAAYCVFILVVYLLNKLDHNFAPPFTVILAQTGGRGKKGGQNVQTESQQNQPLQAGG